ncbi:MAG TPA: ABC transporter permease subunit, partial [Dongiaceae bacterium]
MSDAVAGAPVALETPAAVGLSPFRASWRRYSRNKLALGSMVILLFIVLACFGGPLLFPYGTEDADFDNISAPINLLSGHPFGTDEFGRDLLLRVLVGGQVSLAVGFFGALAAVFIGVVYGATSGYVGGTLDNILMRTVDVLYGIPYFFLVVLINLLAGRTVAGLFISIVVVLWLTPAVIARGQAVSLRHREFVDAARAGGMT